MVRGRSRTVGRGWCGALGSAGGSQTCPPALGAHHHPETVVGAGPRWSLCLLLDHSCPGKSFVLVMGVPDTASRCARSWRGGPNRQLPPVAHGASMALPSVIPDILQERGWKAGLRQVDLNQRAASRGENVCAGCRAVPARSHGGICHPRPTQPWVSPWCKAATHLGLPRRALFFAPAILSGQILGTFCVRLCPEHRVVWSRLCRKTRCVPRACTDQPSAYEQQFRGLGKR